MIHAELSHQLMIHASDEVGTLAEITHVMATSGINLVAMCAYAFSDKVSMMFVTTDNNAARKLLEMGGYKVEEEEVILLSMDNKPGAAQKVSQKLAEAGIDLTLIYGSSDASAEISRIVLISKNNLDAMMVIKTELERG